MGTIQRCARSGVIPLRTVHLSTQNVVTTDEFAWDDPEIDLPQKFYDRRSRLRIRLPNNRGAVDWLLVLGRSKAHIGAIATHHIVVV